MTRRLLDRAPNLPSSDRHRIALILGTALYFGPYQAEECLRAYATEFSFVKDSLLSQAALDNLSGAALAMQGRADESRAQLQRAEERVLDLGLPALSSGFYLGRGEAERLLGRPDLAAAYFRRCTETLDSLGETSLSRAQFVPNTRRNCRASVGEPGSRLGCSRLIGPSRSAPGIDRSGRRRMWIW